MFGLLVYGPGQETLCQVVTHWRCTPGLPPPGRLAGHRSHLSVSGLRGQHGPGGVRGVRAVADLLSRSTQASPGTQWPARLHDMHVTTSLIRSSLA